MGDQISHPITLSDNASLPEVIQFVKAFARSASDASSRNLIQDVKDSGAALSTINNAQANQFPYYTGPKSVTLGNLTSATIAFLAGGALPPSALPITNAQLATMAANTIKGNATGSSAVPTDVPPQTARSSSLLNVESGTLVGDANYTILATDRLININAAFSAPRTFTLPAVSAVNSGHHLIIVTGGISNTNTLTVQRAGADQIYVAIGAAIVTSIVSSGTGIYWEFVALTQGGNTFWLLIDSGPFSATLPGQVPLSGGGTTNFLRADGTWVAPAGPTLTAPTYTALTSGSANYTPPGGVVRIKIRMIAGGGGGGAAATNAGSPGSDTSFGAWTAIHGNGGSAGGGSVVGGDGGTGGVNGTGTLISRDSGAPGGVGQPTPWSGFGGCAHFGGGGKGVIGTTTGVAAKANSGAGGGGGSQAGGTPGGGGGGGEGEYVEFIVTSPGTIAYVVGPGGNGGAAGNQAGGNGGSGIILIEEFYY